MDQYAGSPGHSTYCCAELSASFINFLHYCSPSCGFSGAGKDNRGRHEPRHLPIFMPNALSAATFPIYPGLGQAPNNAFLHTQWLG